MASEFSTQEEKTEENHGVLLQILHDIDALYASMYLSSSNWPISLLKTYKICCLKYQHVMNMKLIIIVLPTFGGSALDQFQPFQ